MPSQEVFNTWFWFRFAQNDVRLQPGQTYISKENSQASVFQRFRSEQTIPTTRLCKYSIRTRIMKKKTIICVCCNRFRISLVQLVYCLIPSISQKGTMSTFIYYIHHDTNSPLI